MTAPVQQTLIEQLRPVLSDGRIGTYLTAAGFDPDRALGLYLWNAQVGEAFHLPIQSAEVALRNRINGALCHVFGADWWRERAFLAVADKDRRDDLNTAQRRILNRGAPLITGQIVAGLSFGFWVGMLQPSYNPPVWGGMLRQTFVGLPASKNRHDLQASARRVAGLRNRIWHHEPLIKMSLSDEYSVVMELLDWLCPIKAAWIKPQCRVPALLRQKP